MNKETEQIIINEYLKGKGSTQIVKIVGLSKPTILKVLNNHNLIRKRDRCNTLDIKKDNDKFYLMWECNRCHNQIKREATNKTILCRNHFKLQQKNPVCKKCSLELQVGEGNPFYGKKHSNETKSHLSKIRKGTNMGDKNPMKKKEYRDKIGKKLLERIKLNPIKYQKISKKEINLLKEIKEIYPDTIGSYVVGRYVCDIFIPSLNIIIEFYGDYWHCNPSKYKTDYYHKHKKKNASEIWKEDELRVDNIKKRGYNLHIIWEEECKTPNYINVLLNILKNVKN